eukprot:GFKZ01009631.1.p1 GENE.GFKZ01009631.1~~GFKZ01009631.1.p1  ORF type:complete len:279 (-),score=31.73 GFKZ01009631.1:2562-3326(-)
MPPPTTAPPASVSLQGPTNTLRLPGDQVATLLDSSTKSPKRAVVRLGGGVRQCGNTLVCSKAGIFRYDTTRNKLWIENNQSRYTASLEDAVIGVVVERFSDEYRVEINGSETATLNQVAFEGATKKNRPHLAVGSVVYCRVIRASKYMESEVSCVEPGSSKSWVGGETLYGELKGGNLVKVSLSLARVMVEEEGGGILGVLGKRVAFESAVGVNGRVWVKGKSVQSTVAICAAIERAEVMERGEWEKMVGVVVN